MEKTPDQKIKALILKADKIQPIKIFGKKQQQIASRIKNIIKEFFLLGNPLELPLQGILLTGPPGCGKTISVRNACACLSPKLSTLSYLRAGTALMDSKWGASEELLRKCFDVNGSEKRVLFLDDVESLIHSRHSKIAQEQHFGLNSTLFHIVEEIDTSKVFVILSSNMPDQIDPAIVDRFLHIEYPIPTKELIKSIVIAGLAKRRTALENRGVFLDDLTGEILDNEIKQITQNITIKNGYASTDMINVSCRKNALSFRDAEKILLRILMNAINI